MPLLQRLGTINTLTALLERVFRWGPTVLGAASASGASAWAAHASAWLNKYGPIAWVGSALVARRRINLNDLKNPLTNRVIGKKFIDCEFMGPANLAFYRN